MTVLPFSSTAIVVPAETEIKVDVVVLPLTVLMIKVCSDFTTVVTAVSVVCDGGSLLAVSETNSLAGGTDFFSNTDNENQRQSSLIRWTSVTGRKSLK